MADSCIQQAAAESESTSYYVNISAIQYPAQVPINSTFQVSVGIDYAMPTISGYSMSTTKWLIQARAYNFSTATPIEQNCRSLQVAGCFLANSNLDEVSGTGSSSLTLTLRAPAFVSLMNFTIFAMYQPVPSVAGINLQYAAVDELWQYTHSSRSYMSLTVQVSNTVKLTVNLSLPNSTAVTVDGFQSYATDTKGHLELNLTALQWHVIDVPDAVELAPGERAIFVSWSDGFSSHIRNWYFSSDTTLTAIYQIQYLLLVSNSDGSGWYDAFTYVTVSAPNVRVPNNVLGLIGYRDVFKNWTGDVRSNNPTIVILMDQPHQIVAEWEGRLTLSLPVIALLLLGFFMLGICLWKLRSPLKKKSTETHRHA